MLASASRAGIARGLKPEKRDEKTLLATSALVVALTVGSASAADLPTSSPAAAPVYCLDRPLLGRERRLQLGRSKERCDFANCSRRVRQRVGDPARSMASSAASSQATTISSANGSGGFETDIQASGQKGSECLADRRRRSCHVLEHRSQAYMVRHLAHPPGRAMVAQHSALRNVRRRIRPSQRRRHHQPRRLSLPP